MTAAVRPVMPAVAGPRRDTLEIDTAPERSPDMAKLSARGRRRVSRKNFAGPGQSFPIHDKAHARKALQLAPRSSKVSTAKVRRAVCRKYPSLGACQPRRSGGRR